MKNLIKRRILLQDKTLEYFFKKSIRTRHVRLSIAPGGVITVTTPWYFSENRIDFFLHRKSDWILKKLKYFEKIGKVNKIGGGRRDYLKNKELARQLVLQKISEINSDGNFVFNRVSIRNNKSRWGSCSKRGNLNFNYRVIYLPEPLVKYLIVHELCHLKELNHSKRFWNLVGEYVPDYKVLTKELKKNIF
jgi:predicted metal-dependent hydrolase